MAAIPGLSFGSAAKPANKQGYVPLTLPGQPTFGQPSAAPSKPKTEEELLREQAVGAAGDIAKQSEQLATDLEARRAAALASLDKATEAGQLDIRASQAEGLAAGQAAAGARGASAFGALGQAAKQSGLAQAGFLGEQAKARASTDVGLAEKIGEARQAAAAQRLEALKFQQEAGTTAKDRQQKSDQYETRLQEIYTDNKGFFNDDEEKAADEIERMVEYETDPVLKQRYMDIAAKVRAGDTDF